MAACGGIRAAAGVPGVGRELVLRHLDAAGVPIAEAALGALVWTSRSLTCSRPQETRADRTALVESARWLAGHPVFAGTGTGLLVDLGRLDNLDEIVGLCAGRPVLAIRTVERVGARLRGLRDRPDPTVLAGIIVRLAGRGDLAGGLFAVVLVRHGAGFSWKTPWRDLLIGLRRHPDADVRDEAYAVDMS